MPSESSSLLHEGNNDKVLETQSTFLLDRSDSFEKGESRQLKAFVTLLACVIMSLVALSIGVVYGVSPPTSDSKAIKRDNAKSDMQLDLLNSLFDKNTKIESGCESTILLIRHCEKNDDGVVHNNGNSYCSWLGRERSYFLPSLFDPSSPRRRWPIPAKIFALTQERDVRYDIVDDIGNPNYREIETVMPLAHKFSIAIEIYPFNQEVLATDFFSLLQSGEMCGKLSVISWKHELIPSLALALACGPDQGCPHDYPDETFDEVWQIKYVLDPEGKAKHSPDPMNLTVHTVQPLSIYQPTKNVPPKSNLHGEENDGNDVVTKAPNNKRRRQLKKHKFDKRKKWVVYGSKTFQYFDPLQFSLQSGDYPPGGSPVGGKWADEI